MIYIYAGILAAGVAIGSAGAWKVQNWRADAADKQRLETQAEDRRMREKAAGDSATSFEQDRVTNEARSRTVTVTVEKIVERPVYRNICLDDDGLRAINDQIRRAANPGEPSSPVPRPAASR